MISVGLPDAAPLLPAIFLYLCVNFFAFLLFGFDKFRAGRRGTRVPETYLLTAAAAGPFGALAGMAWFRHKTRHLKFLLVPFFAFLHLLAFALLSGILQ